MKLFSKYNRINLLATVTIFLLASMAYYFLIRYVIIHQLDENLKIEEDEIQSYAAKYHKLPEVIKVKDQQISYFATHPTGHKHYFRTAVAYDSIEHDAGSFRQLYFEVNAGGNWYLAVVGKSMEGTKKLIQSIIFITISTIILILAASLLINRILLRKLWRPFYSSLESLRTFQLGQKQSVEFPLTDIDEFALMNSVLKQATLKAEQDYHLLREFSENASHEMQTPLAIIRSKTDLLIQDEQLTDRQSKVLLSIYEAIEKLSRLNKSLLLLTKIENRQFAGVSSINLKQQIEGKLLEFRELWQNKNLEVSTDLGEVNLNMNAALADILLNNLISNAIKHNVPGGTIDIVLRKSHELVVRNTGDKNSLDHNRLFSRFYKSNEQSEHTGLGLSIVKQICKVSSCTVAYKMEAGLHSFTVRW